MHQDLLKLPILTVNKIRISGEDLYIEGKFNYMSDFYIKQIEGVSYLYQPPIFYVGNIINFNQSTLNAIFKTWKLEEHKLAVGQEFSWLYGYHQPYYINMFLDNINKWKFKEYPIPGGHTECLICDADIYSKKDCPDIENKFSYVYEEKYWICKDCFEKYLKVNSLEFITPNV